MQTDASSNSASSTLHHLSLFLSVSLSLVRSCFLSGLSIRQFPVLTVYRSVYLPDTPPKS